MTIRRRLFLSFFVILALFALNIVIYRRGNDQRSASFEAVGRAIERQVLVFDIEQELIERRSEVADIRLLADAGLGSLEPEKVLELAAQLESLQSDIADLQKLSDEADRPLIESFGQRYQRLKDDWLAFYRSLEVRPVEDDPEPGAGPEGDVTPPPAPQDESATGDPAAGDPAEDDATVDEDLEGAGDEAGSTTEEPVDLAAAVFELLDVLKSNERQRVAEATARFDDEAAVTDRLTLSIFAFSTLLALAVGLFFSGYLNRGLLALKTGARRIGEGDLEHRIAATGRDELGELASSFNKMSEKLLLARARVEEARAAAEDANQAKSRFLANMSHELRTPMNAIIGYSEMLVEDAEDVGQDEFVPDLKKILAAGKHLLALINDILDLSKIEAGKMTLFLEEFEVAALVEDATATIQPLVEKNRNRLHVELDPEAGTLTADETKVRQIVFNLLSNACKFTKEGTITLDVRRVHAGGEQAAADRLVFEVADTGIGMSAEQMSRVFEEFTQADSSTTRKFGGTGLGLAISKKFCEMMGGEIRVASEEGLGTTFTVELPAVVRASDADKEEAAGAAESAPAEVQPSTAPTPAAAPADSGSQHVPPGADTVLVIDDEATTLDLTRRFLSREGFAVVTASSGARGLELARQLRPDAIVLDVMMPGMDGWTVLSALHQDEATADIPVIMLTMLDEQEMGFALGATEYLMKPIDRERLTGRLEKYRHVHRPDAETDPARVLIVEDDAESRELMRRGLEKDGWSIDEAENGLVGLAKLSEAVPHLILLDLTMPQMDGFDFLQELRSHQAWQSVPVVVVTAKELTSAELARLEGQVDAILRKGAYPRESLLGELRDQVRSSVARRSLQSAGEHGGSDG